MKHAAPEGLVVVAQIAGAHGVRGEARIRSYTEIAEDCFSFGPLLDRDGRVLVTVARFQPHKDVFIVTTKETRQREEWEALKGTDLFAPREAFPDTDEDEFYVADLVGLSVTHADGRSLGVVRHVHNFGAGDQELITYDYPECFDPRFTVDRAVVEP